MSHTRQIEIAGRQIELELTPAAEAALANDAPPMTVEMELYFSCLIRKQVRFRPTQAVEDDALCSQPLPGLRLCFRPVMTRSCGRDYEGDEPPLSDFPIARPGPYVPHWLRLDYRGGQWEGEFGYHNTH